MGNRVPDAESWTMGVEERKSRNVSSRGAESGTGSGPVTRNVVERE